MEMLPASPPPKRLKGLCTDVRIPGGRWLGALAKHGIDHALVSLRRCLVGENLNHLFNGEDGLAGT